MQKLGGDTSLLHLMHVITHAHASTGTTSLMHVKHSTHHLFMALIAWDIAMEKKKERTNTVHQI